MELTGIPLLVVAVLTALGCGTATVVLWSRSGRWRVVVRTVGILVAEAAVVLAAGLAVNRSEQFYPSWAALAGDTGTEVATVPPRAGDLDTALAGGSALSWRPGELRRWRLAAAPTLTVPPDYLAAGSTQYPVIVHLGGADAGAVPPPGSVTIALAPTGATTAEDLRTLVDDLKRDVRVTTGGWAMVAGADDAGLAGRIARALPGQFRALAVVERSATAIPASLGPMPVGTALASVRPVVPGESGTSSSAASTDTAPSGAPAPTDPSTATAAPTGTAPDGTAPDGVTALTGPAPKVWQTALTWAATKLSAPLAAPLLLPTGHTA